MMIKLQIISEVPLYYNTMLGEFWIWKTRGPFKVQTDKICVDI